MRDTFLADWKAAYETIKEVYPEARIAGPGDAWWHGTSTRQILTYAKAHDVLPDMWTWHELGVENLATFRSHLAEFRRIEQEVGVGPLPVNITEYAMRRDMGVPGQLVQWISMFEDEKVDAQTAYWTFAGNLNDNMAKNNGANGAWWLLKWYGDLTGRPWSSPRRPWTRSTRCRGSPPWTPRGVRRRCSSVAARRTSASTCRGRPGGLRRRGRRPGAPGGVHRAGGRGPGAAGRGGRARVGGRRRGAGRRPERRPSLRLPGRGDAGPRRGARGGHDVEAARGGGVDPAVRADGRGPTGR